MSGRGGERKADRDRESRPSPAVIFRRAGSFQTELVRTLLSMSANILPITLQKGSSLCLEEVVIVTKEVTMSQTPPWLYGWEDLSCELNTHLLKQEKKEEEEEEEETT